MNRKTKKGGGYKSPSVSKTGSLIGDDSSRSRSPSIERPHSNREIENRDGTVLRFEAAEWNNVPKIVYESLITLVTHLDHQQKQKYI